MGAITEWFNGCVITKAADTDLVLYAAVGLAGETGETCELIKKSRRTGARHEAIDIADLTSELGDVLFYAAAIANAHGITLDQIVDVNLAKRVKRGIITDGTTSGRGGA